MSRVLSGRRVGLGTLVLSVALSSLGAAAEPDDSKGAAPAGNAAGNQEPQATPTPEPKPDDETAEGWHREGLGFKNGKSSINLAGYLQWDFRNFDWEPQETDLGRLLAEDRELRRFRIGFQARFDDLFFEFVVDPRQGPDAPLDPDFWDKLQLKDATVGYRFSKEFTVLVGHFKPQVSPEFLTSGSKTDLVERSMAAARLAPDRDWGAGISGELGKVGYAVGGFAGDGSADPRSAKASGTARLTFEARKGLVAGGSFMLGTVEPEPREGGREPVAKGASGRTTTGFTFWDRAHVKGTRRRLGGDLEYKRGPFRVIGEYLEVTEQREGQGSTGQDIPDVRGRGWSAQASYVLTGERKGSTVEPRRSVLTGGFGAVELAARVEGLKFDDTGDPEGFAGYGNRARNIAPSGATAIELGVNYWATNFTKIQGNAIWESYNDPLIAPVPGNTGRYFTLMARIQLMIP